MVRIDARTSQADAQGACVRFAAAIAHSTTGLISVDRKEAGIGFARRHSALAKGSASVSRRGLSPEDAQDTKQGMTDAAG